MMIEVRTMQAREILCAERLREIEADDFRAQRRVERADIEMLPRVLSVSSVSNLKFLRMGGRRHANCLKSAKAFNLRAPIHADNEANPIRLSNQVIKALLTHTAREHQLPQSSYKTPLARRK
ncbi:hypothetical protein [Paraburkholderia bannensis]|uniref:hypothetical protein n=1 Tax=Paraburkholderia bannensis TaxID=765414 RepID=UPI002AB075BB|nr:hypothetical protein [Paraburkholderia bannensis]